MKPELTNKRERRAGRRRGQSLVEFTLTMPMMFVMVTGMLSFGIAMHDFLVLTNGVNIAAQQLAISRGQTTDPCSTAYTAIRNAAPSLTATGITVSFVINGTSYSSTTSCTSGASEMVQGASAQISATYPCKLGIYGLAVPSCSLGTQTTELIQ